MRDQDVTYDLVLMLDHSAEDAVKQRVLSSTRASIEAAGEIVRHDDWGLRQLAYPIDHKTEAEYHLFQFHVREKALLDELERSLRIADGALRFMVTKVRPGTPGPPALGSRSGRQAESEAPAPA
ncbi:MAG: 30S ribosomal protein S6 [Solirubrobacteraceae bacterium]